MIDFKAKANLIWNVADFYEFKPLRSLVEIKADILALEQGTVELEKKVLE